MKCEEAREWIQRDLDGDLLPAEKEALTEHLRLCKECRNFQEKILELHLGLASLPKVHPPYSLVDAILPRLEEMEDGIHPTQEVIRKKQKPVRWIRYASIAAAFALIGLTFVQWMRGFAPVEKNDLPSARQGEIFVAGSNSATSEKSTQRSGTEEDKTKGAEEPHSNGEEQPSTREMTGAMKDQSTDREKADTVNDTGKKTSQPVEKPPQERNAPMEEPPDIKPDQVHNQVDSSFVVKGDQNRKTISGDDQMGITTFNIEQSETPQIYPSPENRIIAEVTSKEIRFLDSEGKLIDHLRWDQDTIQNFTWIDEKRVQFEIVKEDGDRQRIEYHLDTKQIFQVGTLSQSGS